MKGVTFKNQKQYKVLYNNSRNFYGLSLEIK